MINDLKEYLIDCEIQGYTPATIKQKEYSLKMFIRYVEENQHHPSTDEEWLKEFKRYLHMKKMNGASKAYIKNLVITQKAFNKSTGKKWLDSMPLPKTSKPLPRIVKPAEWESIRSAQENTAPITSAGVWEKYRNILILDLLYNCGLRVSELVSLKVGDIDVVEKIIHVNGGKGDKDRVVLFNDDVLQSYDKYMDLSGEFEKEEYLLRNRKNKPSYKRLSTRTVQIMLQNASKRAGLDHTCTPHMFRHAYATNLARAGVNVRAIQMLLGHSSLNTTQVYLNFTLEDIKDELSKIQ